MSSKKCVIEIYRPTYGRMAECFSVDGFQCDRCSGRGSFNHEIGVDQFETTICSQCDGSGVLKALVQIKWVPGGTEK